VAILIARTPIKMNINVVGAGPVSAQKKRKYIANIVGADDSVCPINRRNNI